MKNQKVHVGLGSEEAHTAATSAHIQSLHIHGVITDQSWHLNLARQRETRHGPPNFHVRVTVRRQATASHVFHSAPTFHCSCVFRQKPHANGRTLDFIEQFSVNHRLSCGWLISKSTKTVTGDETNESFNVSDAHYPLKIFYCLQFRLASIDQNQNHASFKYV